MPLSKSFVLIPDDPKFAALASIVGQLQQATDIQSGLASVVTVGRNWLKSDRLLVYQFLAEEDGVVLAESVAPPCSAIIGQLIYDPCFQRNWQESYCQGRVHVVDDVNASYFPSCYQDFLTSLQVQANLVLPILIHASTQGSSSPQPTLWGLLIAHQATPRQWRSPEIEFLKQITLHLGWFLKTQLLQQQLAETQYECDRWQLAMDGAEDSFWDWNADTNEISVSTRWKAMLGYEDSEIGNTLEEWKSRIHPDDRDATYTELMRYLQGQTPIYTSQHRLRCKDGTWKWILDRGKVVARTQDGEPLRIVGTHTDISTLKDLQLKLKHRDATLKRLTEQVPGVLYQYRLHPDGRSCFPYASDAIQSIYEVTPEQVKQNADLVMQRLHPKDYDSVVAKIQRSFSNLTLWYDEYRVVLPDRGERWLEGHAMPEALDDGSVLWHGYIRDITDRKQAETRLMLQSQREQMIYEIAQHIHQSLDLYTTLHTAVTEIRQFLQTDRVLVFKFHPDWSGTVIEESVAEGFQSILHWQITDTYFVETEGGTYPHGTVKATHDIYAAALDPCHIEFLEQMQVRATLIVPILQGSHLWGLLVAHQCDQPRVWQPVEGEILVQLATQLAIAIQQSELYGRVQELNTGLEQQVQQRTTQLEQSLHFEALLKRITDNVRDSLDEHQILKTAVEELAQGLAIEACDTGIYSEDQTISTIVHECTHSLFPSQGISFAIAEAPHAEVYSNLFRGEVCHFSDRTPNPLRSDQLLTVLACPIIDDQGVLGDLWLFKAHQDWFSTLEIRLVQQVANQCAIALRQSRLYQAAQAQVEELARLNHLKDDFLNTVTHELRTPLANIQLCTQMLQNSLQSLHLFADPTHEVFQYLQVLQTESEQEFKLINDLLDLTHLDSGTEPLFITAINLPYFIHYLTNSFEIKAQEHQQQFQLDLPDDLPWVNTDQSYLERSLVELLNNACKYTPSGEMIRLSVEALSDQVAIHLTNTGVTIPPDECDRIFEKFYRIPDHDPWKHGGTGLGLALVEKMITYLQGQITLQSQDNQVTFSIYLPWNLDP